MSDKVSDELASIRNELAEMATQIDNDGTASQIVTGDELRALAARINSAIEPAAVADGYVMVPVEPTEAMRDAAMDWLMGGADLYVNEHNQVVVETATPRDVWKLMLAARPISASGRDGE